MKRIYITEGLIRYSVKIYKSSGKTAIVIKMVGENFPEWGSIIDPTINERKYAKDIIKTWASK